MNVKRKPAKAERPTSKMRTIFREVARDIVARDRKARKGGRTQNTIGEIERAMVKAYVCGQEALLNKREGFRPSVNALVDWLEIPPRARETLSFLTICFSHRWSASPQALYAEQRFSGHNVNIGVRQRREGTGRGFRG
ncbi:MULTISPECIES: hypothetical protein [unclassified Blastomonas]|uniref:hypothetical protein n=2 Tax=Sphingomonadales TaxID=204457 RepID=UPI000B26C53D|nr:MULTISPECIES: hypothetical protein [unclassified Blastomonas]